MLSLLLRDERVEKIFRNVEGVMTNIPAVLQEETQASGLREGGAELLDLVFVSGVRRQVSG